MREKINAVSTHSSQQKQTNLWSHSRFSRFTTRRYASALYAMAMYPCPSVRLSQVGVLLIRLNESSCFFGMGPFSTYPTMCYKDIPVHAKIRFGLLPSGTLSQTLDLEIFATASRWCCQQNSSTVELVDHSHEGRRLVTGHT